MKVGIVGKGFVGNSMYECFKDKFEVGVYDVDQTKTTFPTISELVFWADILFVSVPTPMAEDGSCNISIVESVVKSIAATSIEKIVVVKSTVPPGTTKRLAEKYGLKMGFNPEFLTEANSVADFLYQPLIIVGADDEETRKKIWELYYSYVAKVGYMPNMMNATTAEAELFKYLANAFLAVKVIFANEMKLLCDKVGIDYNNLAKIAKTDRRLGATHWQVPGPDGKFGYGGSCFPKDTSALVSFAESVGVDLWVLTDAMYVNDDIRESNYFKKLEILK